MHDFITPYETKSMHFLNPSQGKFFYHQNKLATALGMEFDDSEHVLIIILPIGKLTDFETHGNVQKLADRFKELVNKEMFEKRQKVKVLVPLFAICTTNNEQLQLEESMKRYE